MTFSPSSNRPSVSGTHNLLPDSRENTHSSVGGHTFLMSGTVMNDINNSMMHASTTT